MCVEEDERGGRGEKAGWLVDRRSCERLNANANEVLERRRCVKRLING